MMRGKVHMDFSKAPRSFYAACNFRWERCTEQDLYCLNLITYHRREWRVATCKTKFLGSVTLLLDRQYGRDADKEWAQFSMALMELNEGKLMSCRDTVHSGQNLISPLTLRLSGVFKSHHDSFPKCSLLLIEKSKDKNTAWGQCSWWPGSTKKQTKTPHVCTQKRTIASCHTNLHCT